MTYLASPMRCDEVVVLLLDGWLESVGVTTEIQIARALGKPVRHIAPEAPVVPPTFAQVAREATP